MSSESLSALFDGECSDAEIERLLGQMGNDPQLAQRWSRWQLQRDLQEGVVYSKDQRCICAGVMAGLEEPAARGRVVDLSAWRRRVVALPWKPALGFAAAASMGAAAVLFVLPQKGGVDVQSASASTSMVPNVKVSSPISLPGSRGRLQSVSLNGDNPGPTFADEEYAELLRDYLVSRNNSNSYSDQGGTLRYARYTAAEADAKR